MKILVTGSNGLLGQKLTELLIKDKAVQLIATASRPSILPLPNAEFYLLDITNENEVDNIITRVEPDVIINTAAMTQVDQCESQREACWKANVSAVENLIKASRKINAHFIHVSTDFI